MFRKIPTITSSGPDQPFWKDELDFQQLPGNFDRFARSILIVGRIFIFLWLFAILFGVFFEISPTFAWGLLISYIILFGIASLSGIYERKRRKLILQEISQIQQLAREKTGASLIGNAIHVAGNPRLNREQKVVLALTPSSLVIYPYDHGAPLDTISLKQITAIHTVVYDDERTPHLETVDSTAQALQLTIKYGDTAYDCLLRNMRKVRPIDWYHGIQKARIQDNTQIS
ncbi:MAG: hypothetical protein A2030_08140 [Chloroflexi bacterium RBG_19FT_COMBO_50_10]|nr:MAG: hypothetical protein A2Y53_03505 [Chloroflexi bacterium RBG_16_47_49]OGO66288.1 MAG: hypothetical protein A2030_08140 [Chloroflexi bacterium RBG_19FT_COMBO_50_10]